jgi:hypothetical protein
MADEILKTSAMPNPGLKEPKRVPMINEYDEAITVDPTEVQEAIAQGYKIENPLDEAGRKYAESRPGLSGAAQVFTKNAINEALFGVPSVLESKGDPLELAKAKALEKRHGVASLLGSGTGFIGSLWTGAPLFKGGAKLGEGIVKGIGRVAAAESGGQLATRTATSTAKELVKRMGESAIKYGTEGAVQMAPMAITEEMLGDHDAAVESLLWGIGAGSLFGGAGTLGKDVAKIAKTQLAERGIEGIGGLAKEAGKKAARVLTGAPEEAMERYIQRQEKVANALPFDELRNNLITKIDDAVENVSLGSSEGYKILETSGKKFHSDEVAKPINDLIGFLEERGKYSPEMKGAAKRMSDLRDVLQPPVPEGTRGKPFRKKVDALEVRRVLDQLRDDKAIVSKMDLGKSAQIKGAFERTAGQINAVLKKDLPDYAKHMEGVAKNTVALKGVRENFRNGKPENMMKRIMRGRDPDAADALKAFDAQNGTDFFEEIQDAFALQQLSKETTQGSRKTLLGTVLGGTFGGPLGGMIGAGVGAVADKYGTMLARKSVDGILLAEKALRRTAENLDELPGIIKGMKNFKPKATGGDSATLHAALRMFGEEPKPNESKEKVWEKMNKKVYDYVDNIDKLSDKVAEVTSPIEQTGAPNVAGMLNTKLVNAHDYILKSMPKEFITVNPFSKVPPRKPAKRDLHSFFQKLQVIEDPFSVLKELKNGTLTRNHMDALKYVYPRMHGLMQDKVRNTVLGGVEPIPYNARIQLSLLMDEPFDNSLQAGSLQKSQAAFAYSSGAEEEEQQQDGAAFEGDLSSPMQTEVESLSS